MSENKKIQFLKTQFSKVDDEVFDKITSYDPTPGKKYSTWLLRLYSKSSLSLNDLPTISELISLHISLKDSIPLEFRDINSFDSVVSFLHSMNVWFANRFIENEKNVTYLKNGGDLLFENDDIQIIKILSYEGSKNYGSNTSWCTLQIEQYNNYSSKDYLYILITKTSRYKSYLHKKTQLFFPTSEFRNEKNDEVDLIESIIAFPELYDPIKIIGKRVNTFKSEEIFNFFNLKEDSDSLIKTIEKRGWRIIKFIDVLTKEIIDSLFVHFKEDAYEHIPDSINKTKSFICNVEGGLKQVIKKNNVEVDEESFKEAVRSFPENILLMNCDDEDLWKYSVIEEPWLVKKSPFFNSSEKLLLIIKENLDILKYIKLSNNLFSQEQKEQISFYIIDDSCENYLEFISSLGELSEKNQLSLIEKNLNCFSYLKSPSEKAIKLYEKIKKKKEDEEAEKLKQKSNEHEYSNEFLKYFIDKKRYDSYSNDDIYEIIKEFSESSDGKVRRATKRYNQNGDCIEYYYDDDDFLF